MTVKCLENIKNTKLISLTVLFTVFNISFNSATAEASSSSRSIESRSTVSPLQIDSDLTLGDRQQTIIANSFGGQASWYGPGFHGNLTANGEVYNQDAMTAAHPSLSFGTKVRVTNLNNGRSVIVRINDRGPYAGGRVIDLSAAAARSLNMINTGVAPVEVTVLE